MPIVHFADQSIECLHGANLSIVLVRARLPLYNSAAQALNCRGRGVCGTCTVRIEGKVSEPTGAEHRRLAIFPHNQESGLRLACQCNVLGDITVTKQDGHWGQRADSPDDSG